MMGKGDAGAAKCAEREGRARTKGVAVCAGIERLIAARTRSSSMRASNRTPERCYATSSRYCADRSSGITEAGYSLHGAVTHEHLKPVWRLAAGAYDTGSLL